jgi:ATP-binding cassette subfamily B (MDR/TAP) protein 1
LLNKSLYGLKQAPKNWSKTITARPKEYGFNQSKVDPGIYVFITEGKLYVLALYVDNGIIVRPAGTFIVGFKSAFGEMLNVQDLGPVSWLLGMTVERDRGNRIIRIEQQQ